jgi:plasmid stabilization system protein ParE
VRPRRWTSLALWAVAILAAVEATGVALGRWALTQTGQVLAASGASVFAVLLWVALDSRPRVEARHANARSAEARARVVRGIREAIDNGDLDVPEAGRPGPPYATPDRRAYPGRPLPGGRRRTDPPPRRGGRDA